MRSNSTPAATADSGYGATFALIGWMTNATKNPEGVKGAKDSLLLEHEQDMTNPEKRKIVEELETLLDKAGCNVSELRQAAISQISPELRQVQDSFE